MPAVSTGPLPLDVDLATLLDVHEARQALLARVAYSLLRLTAAVPSSAAISVAASAAAATEAMAWLSGSATNPGRWASRSVLRTELAELDELLAGAGGHLNAVLAWIGPSTTDRTVHTLRLPRSLASECEALVTKLAVEIDTRA
jgi:hypothetical protein